MLRRLLGFCTRAGHAEQSHIERGKTLAAAGRHADAVVAYGQAIAVNAISAEAHYRLGLAWRDQQKFPAAIECYRRALAIRPDYIEVHNNLGVVLQLDNRLADALACYRRAVELSPDFSQPYLNLGRLCEILGQRQEAARCYRMAISAKIDPETFRHLLDAAEGVTTSRAPAAYARTVFDSFAEHFDHRLVDDLGYRIPQILCERVIALCGPCKLRVLDLGCGTGLCGAQIKHACKWLAGVDVSPAMLAIARRQKIYDSLTELDVAEYLTSAPVAAFDVALAADVFIYIGDLTEIFTAVARALAAEGVFAFSVERAMDEHDYVLQPNGRYAQSARYIRRIAAHAGLTEVESFGQTIRGAPGTGAPGLVFLLRKS